MEISTLLQAIIIAFTFAGTCISCWWSSQAAKFAASTRHGYNPYVSLKRELRRRMFNCVTMGWDSPYHVNTLTNIAYLAVLAYFGYYAVLISIPVLMVAYVGFTVVLFHIHTTRLDGNRIRI